MQKVITYENLRNFAYSNDKICKMPIKGIALYFYGCGNQPDFDEDIPVGQELAKEGILLVIPYYNPWSWMNEQALLFTEDILNVLRREYSLPDHIPVVSSGLSMGGLSALVWAKNAKPSPVACVLNCPVCDIADLVARRPNAVYRTVYSAFYSVDESGRLEDAYLKVSPMHLADELPYIDYFVFQCEEDKHINKATQSDLFVEKMRRLGRNVVYHTIPENGHCDLPADMEKLFRQYIICAVSGSETIQ